MVGLKKRILDIAYKNKLSHLGSYLSSVDIIDEIYNKKSLEDIFILSSGHAALAMYVVIEKYTGIDAEKLFKKHGGHPHRDESNGIFCSTGSLGMGLTVAVGRALANPSKKIYVLISDGECAEGSIWESLRFIKENNLENTRHTVVKMFFTKKLQLLFHDTTITSVNSRIFFFKYFTCFCFYFAIILFWTFCIHNFSITHI